MGCWSWISHGLRARTPDTNHTRRWVFVGMGCVFTSLRNYPSSEAAFRHLKVYGVGDLQWTFHLIPNTILKPSPFHFPFHLSPPPPAIANTVTASITHQYLYKKLAISPHTIQPYNSLLQEAPLIHLLFLPFFLPLLCLSTSSLPPPLQNRLINPHSRRLRLYD